MSAFERPGAEVDMTMIAFIVFAVFMTRDAKSPKLDVGYTHL